MKRNPSISEITLLKIIRRFTIKRNLAMLFSVFLFLGVLVAYSYPEQTSLKFSLTLFLLLSSIFMTSVGIQQTLVAGVYEPLKILPVPAIERHISALLLLDSLTTLGLVIPSVISIAFVDLLDSLIYFLWMLFAVLFGHIIGMAFLVFFGVKVGKMPILMSKAIYGPFIILLILLLIPEFLGFGISREIIEISDNYYFIYPFTVLRDANESALPLIIHFAILIPLDRIVSKRFFIAICEPRIRKEVKTTFRVLSWNKTFMLVFKDFKIISRHPSGVVGTLLPFLILFPNIIGMAMVGEKSAVIHTIASTSLFAPIILGIITRGEGKEIDFLKILPISKKEFMFGKLITTSLILCSTSAVLSMVAIFLGITPTVFLISIPMPLTISTLTALYLFNYPSNEVGIPEMGLRRMSILFILSIFVVATLMLPIHILSEPIGFALTFLFSLIFTAIMFFKMRN
ncbi:MAG: hypothetical protein N3D09_05105 [Archaeoglobaceae archaeon]|nr:hypothetical protein [Archaeoglobaceae archaeon]